MIDIEELKKLPIDVKVDLIDQLLHSINEKMNMHTKKMNRMLTLKS